LRRSEEEGLASSQPALRVYPGNEEAYVYFQPVCGSDTLSPANSQSPPCNDSLPVNIPSHYQFVVSKHAESGAEVDLQHIVQTVASSAIYCFDQRASTPCHGGASSTHSRDCTCIAKLSSLPKYVQLRVVVHAVYSAAGNSSSSVRLEQFLGASLLFALTDVATPAFLSSLYGIPPGLSVQHGSNQSVAEFYGEVVCIVITPPPPISDLALISSTVARISPASCSSRASPPRVSLQITCSVTC